MKSLPEGQGSISVLGTYMIHVLIRQGGYFQELVRLIQGLPKYKRNIFKNFLSKGVNLVFWYSYIIIYNSTLIYSYCYIIHQCHILAITNLLVVCI